VGPSGTIGRWSVGAGGQHAICAGPADVSARTRPERDAAGPLSRCGDEVLTTASARPDRVHGRGDPGLATLRGSCTSRFRRPSRSQAWSLESAATSACPRVSSRRSGDADGRPGD